MLSDKLLFSCLSPLWHTQQKGIRTKRIYFFLFLLFGATQIVRYYRLKKKTNSH